MNIFLSVLHDGANISERDACDIVVEVYERYFDCTKYANVEGIVFILLIILMFHKVNFISIVYL